MFAANICDFAELATTLFFLFIHTTIIIDIEYAIINPYGWTWCFFEIMCDEVVVP